MRRLAALACAPDELSDWVAGDADAQEAQEDDLVDQLEATTLDGTDSMVHAIGSPAPALAASPAHMWEFDEWPRLESNREPPGPSATPRSMAWLSGPSAAVLAAPPPTPIDPNMGKWQAGSPSQQLLLSPRRRAFPRGLASALRVQERALCASKLRGATRRGIGKGSRREAHVRVRRLLPMALLDEHGREATFRRSREEVRDSRLARMAEGLTL